MGKTQDLYEKAKTIIPGGTQLLSKRPEMFLPDYWPAYYSKSKGCEVWDLDGNKYIDTSLMGVGACILGYADEDVDNAVKEAIDQGSMSTLNSPYEVELAQLLLKIHPWADMARFARTGGESVSVAVRIARAKTNKDVVLFCGYHGWTDWYLAANLSDDKALDGHLIPGLNPNGVPRHLTGSSFPFYYNDVKGFKELIAKHQGNIAAIVMEPLRNQEPTKEFIETLRSTCDQYGIVLILDEVSYGWRLTVGGAHLKLGIEPDMAIFAKGMSNGYPMAAIIGKNKVMQAAQESFISSTYWTESTGPAAALATIRKMEKEQVYKHLSRIGRMVMEGWVRLADKHGLKIKTSGFYPVGHFGFDYPNKLELKTLYTQLMLDRGFLAFTGFYVSYAHKDEHIQKYMDATDESFKIIVDAISSDSVKEKLKGDVCHSGFKRLT